MDAQASGLKERHAAVQDTLPDLHHIIGGETVSTASAGIWTAIDPATGNAYAEVPLGGAEEIDLAVRAARRALPEWRAMPPSEKRDILLRFGQLLAGRVEELAMLSAIENGIPSEMLSWQALGAIEWFNYYAGWADKITGTVTSDPSAEDFVYTLPEPYGVVATIVTWNGPFMSLAMKCAPALAAGNTIVIKAPEVIPASVQRFVEIFREACLPDGVLNVVHGGADAGQAIVSHPGVDKITFTGGISTARQVLGAAASLLTPSVLELGGKSANLVFEDADLDEACPFAVTMCMLMAGQACIAGSRLLVQESIYDDVVERVGEAAAGLVVGDPLEQGVFMGPLVSRASRDRVLDMVDRAVSAKAGKLLCGGGAPGGPLSDGWFMEPTVLVDVDPKSDISQNEVFGPVLAITPFKTEEEAVEIANGTDYGLSTFVQTRDMRRVRRLAPLLRSGTIGVNTALGLHHSAPFGGVGNSGFGKEGGFEGLEEFVHRKTVLIR